MKKWTKWYSSNTGNDGWDTGVDCPIELCSGTVVYNGNYFCSQFSSTCHWAMSHDEPTGYPIGERDRVVWEKLKVANKNES